MSRKKKKHTKNPKKTNKLDSIISEENSDKPVAQGSGENDVYKKNLQDLRTCHPHIEGLLDQAAPFDIKVCTLSSGLPNLLISKQGGSDQPLYPDYDLSNVKNTIQHIKGKVICLMGAGLFRHVQPILDLVGNTNLVVFFEAFPAVFRTSLEISDWTTILSHPNLRLAIGDSADPYVILKGEREKFFTNDNGEFVEFNDGISLAPEWYKSKKKSFEQFLKRRKITNDAVAFSGKSFLENSFRNLLALSESRPIDDLQDAFKGIPAILVASGPSLSKNIHHLKTTNGKALIIAADSALAPLMSQGIKPHIIVSVDNNEFTFEKLAPFIDTLSDVDLVYIPTVTPKIVNGIRFKSKYYTFPDTSIQSLFNRILGREGQALEDIHSVIHLAIATAQVVGCDPIIFTGLDLAFCGIQDHVDGTILHWGNNKSISPSDVMVESIHGDMIPSSNGFVGMIDICQRMIQTAPDRTYIDATEGGAKIGGTTIMPLAHTLEHHCRQCTEVSEIKRPLSSQTKSNVILHELKKMNHDLGQSFEQINRYMTEQKISDAYLAKQPAGIDPGSLPKKVLRSVQIMDRINIQLETEQTVFFVKSIILEGHERYKDLELNVMESRSSKGHRFAAALKQQRFVQALRKTGLDYLSMQVENAMSLVEMIIDLEGRKCFSDHVLIDQIEQLINQGYLINAETILEAMNQHPQKDYFWGCIALKKAQIKKGEIFFQKVLEKDNELLPKVKQFKKSIINEWLKQDQFSAYKKIGIERVLELQPGHTGALQLKQEWLLQQARGLIHNGQFETALNELLIESEKDPFDHGDLSALFSCLLLTQGQMGQGLDHLKRFIEKESDSTTGIAVVRNYLLKLCDSDVLSMDHPWMIALVDHAKNETWARCALQDFFLTNIGDSPGKIFRRQISARELDEVGLLLTSWKGIKTLIPDWSYLEAYKLLAMGEFESAESELEHAIVIENNTIQISGRIGTLHYLLCIFALFAGKEKKVLSMIRDVILSYPDNIYRLTASLLFIRNNEEDKAEALLEEIFYENKDSSWISAVGDVYQEGHLIREFKPYNALSFLSAYFLFIGKCCVKSEFNDLGLKFLRAAVNHDPKALGVEEGAWLRELIVNSWNEDIPVIEAAISKGCLNEAEKRLGEWRETRTALDNYHTVMADFIEASFNVEKAIEYLQASVKETSDNPHTLFYLSKRLFETGKRDDALSFLERAVFLNSQAASLLEKMGDVWLNENNYPMALVVYEKFLTAFPDNMDVLQKIGDVYKQMGQLDAAEMAYNVVLAKKGQQTNG